LDGIGHGNFDTIVQLLTPSETTVHDPPLPVIAFVLFGPLLIVSEPLVKNQQLLAAPSPALSTMVIFCPFMFAAARKRFVLVAPLAGMFTIRSVTKFV
jgi:hypothetical protein